MKTSRVGDRVQVHYVQRFPDGAIRSSRARGEPPLELTIGTDHPRLPGIGTGLIGLSEGNSVRVAVSAEMAFGMPDPSRIHRVARGRFFAGDVLKAGRRARMQTGPGRVRTVRVVEVRKQFVVIDTNHPRSGQAIDLEVELITILADTPENGHRGP